MMYAHDSLRGKATMATDPGGADGQRTASAHSRELAEVLTAMIGRHYEEAVHRFDYGAAAVSSEYNAMLEASAGLEHMDPRELPDETAMKAFWLNAYNTLVLLVILGGSIASSIREQEDFFHAPTLKVAGLAFDLDAIEHGVLRRNGRKYMALRPLLAREDPRLAWQLPALDPRIHFALHTGTLSAPRLRAFDGADAEAQLEAATREYLNQHVTVSPESGAVRLPAIFRWYTADFGGSVDDARLFVRDHVDDPALGTAVADFERGIEFADFDWRLNDRFGEGVRI